MKRLPQNPPLIVTYDGGPDDLTVRLAIAQRAGNHLIVQYTLDGAVVNDCIIGFRSRDSRLRLDVNTITREYANFNCLRCREPARFHP